MHVIETGDGRVVTGMVVEERDNALTLQTANERIVLPADEVERRERSGASMMPEGLLQHLSQDDVRDLFAYLAGEHQTPPAAGQRQTEATSR